MSPINKLKNKIIHIVLANLVSGIAIALAFLLAYDARTLHYALAIIILFDVIASIYFWFG
jgi:hypothetical protein